MRKGRINKDSDYDTGLQYLVNQIKKTVEKGDDDFLLMCVGPTGTGKSSLMLHAYELYAGEIANVNTICLDRSDFANGMKTVKDSPQPRFLANDEANLSKRDSITKYNKAVIDLYFSIRGLNIFHWWNNPSIDYIDKLFIEEKINGMILITSKEKNAPRVYYYFGKKGLLQIYEKYGNLKIKTITKVKKKYCMYRGAFRPYKGRLWEDYSQKKQDRMKDKVDNFFEEYGDDSKSQLEGIKYTKIGKVAKALSMDRNTIKNKMRKFIEEGDMVSSVHYVIDTSGYWSFSEEGITRFRELTGMI